MISSRSLKMQTIVCFILLLGILLLETYTDIDLYLQRPWYNFENQKWLITDSMHKILTYVFYTGYKVVLGIVGFICLIQSVINYKKKNWKKFRNYFLFVFAVGLTPLFISWLKATTNIYCPDQIKEFGGRYVYQRVLEPANPANQGEGMHRGRGFPAGHASGAFGVMVLYFIWENRQKWYGLGLGLLLGWITAMYQVFRGEHFMSHNFVTMIIAWQIIILLVFITDKWLEKKKAD